MTNYLLSMFDAPLAFRPWTFNLLLQVTW